jgi:hypothetical protein
MQGAVLFFSGQDQRKCGTYSSVGSLYLRRLASEKGIAATGIGGGQKAARIPIPFSSGMNQCPVKLFPAVPVKNDHV